jgi:predicted dienelactone hydrolase
VLDSAAQQYKSAPGPHSVNQFTATWRDAARSRDVPVRVYRPATAAAPAPLVVFSHGTGSSCDGYAYLGLHWASHGYVVIHPTHVGSDTTALFVEGFSPVRRLAEILADVTHRHDRPRDVSFVLDSVAADPELSAHVDLERVAVAGHSYGAYTALTMVGLHDREADQLGLRLDDSRVKAAIAMSPQSEANLGLHAAAWDRIDRPAMALTGTKDIEYGIGTAARRRTSFDRTPGPDQYLLTIHGATHSSFDDPPELRIHVKPPNPAHHAYIRTATTAFLDAYLNEDAAAQRWLLNGAIGQLSGAGCTLEHKHVTPIARGPRDVNPGP